MWRALRLLAALAVPLLAAGCSEPPAAGGPPQLRRLTEAQYRQIIADLFGPDIAISGRFDPLPRQAGLQQVGASQAAINASGYEHLDVTARAIARQVVDERHRGFLIGCEPAQPEAPDSACAGAFLGKVGRLLYRRPLHQEELQRAVTAAELGARALGDFHAGLGFALAGLLVAPDFLYVADAMEADPGQPDRPRLTGSAKAARLSFLLWNTAPDGALLDAAERGDLHSERGVREQVDRMLASPRLNDGIRAFFADMLGFDPGQAVAKDPVLYPAFKPVLAQLAQEQTLRTIVDHLVDRQGDYRELFTTRRTFLTRQLALLYRVPVAAPDNGWVPFEFAADDPRVGLLGHVSFVALHAHPGRSSATLRGKAVRELLLCQPVPDPPNNVNFTVVQDTSNPRYRTARERLVAHSGDPTCAGCHKAIDPIGLALENFDGAGQYRVAENGAEIDASGVLGDRKFTGVAGLGRALYEDPAASHCAVERLYAYAVGRAPLADDQPWIELLARRFAADGYRVPALLRLLATSPALFAVTVPPQRSASAGDTAVDAPQLGERK